MPEQFSKGNIEAEIAELSKQIEQKRNLLESQKGIIEEKELVRTAIGEKISSRPVASSPSPASVSTSKFSVSATSYLDSVDESTEQEINRLLSIVFEKGMEEAIKEAEKGDAFIIDAFHDALVDKMYGELKARGIVK